MHAAGPSSQATARVVVHATAHIAVSAPVAVTVDLADHRIGSPIPAHVRFLVQANAPEVELQIACADLYQAGDPTSAHRIPVAGAGAQITCDRGHAVAGGPSLLRWQPSPGPGALPAGWANLGANLGSVLNGTSISCTSRTDKSAEE